MVKEQGWRRGFANLLRHENAIWWRSRRWWLNIVIWLLLINAPILGLLTSGAESSGVARTPAQVRAEALTVFAVMAGLFGTIGAVIAVQGAIIDEKKSGTAAWVLSKPASRSAFILAKLLANAIALFVVILLVQGLVFYLLLGQLVGNPPSLTAFISGLMLLALHQLFYESFTLMLGTLFSERGPVIGIPMGVLFAPMFVIGIVGQAAYLMPWALVPAGDIQGLAVEAMQGQALSSMLPIVATVAWIVFFVAVALWRFQREEF